MHNVIYLLGTTGMSLFWAAFAIFFIARLQRLLELKQYCLYCILMPSCCRVAAKEACQHSSSVGEQHLHLIDPKTTFFRSPSSIIWSSAAPEKKI